MISERDAVESIRRVFATHPGTPQKAPHRAIMDGGAIREQLKRSYVLKEAPQVSPEAVPARTVSRIPNGDPALFSAAIDVIVGYGCERAAEIAAGDIDPRVRGHIEKLLSMSAQERANVVRRYVRRPLQSEKAQTARAVVHEYESRGALLPSTPLPRRARR